MYREDLKSSYGAVDAAVCVTFRMYREGMNTTVENPSVITLGSGCTDSVERLTRRKLQNSMTESGMCEES